MKQFLVQKPHWLRKKIRHSECSRTKELLRSLNLHTVCEEAMCPNIGECFRKNIAAFMILGSICTRDCKFCGVQKGMPASPDKTEPKRVAEAVKILNLKHAVITSVTRDDLPDKGSSQFVETVTRIRELSAGTKIELLIPDFNGEEKLIKQVIAVKPDILNHNIETVKRLYPEIRPKSDYNRSLRVLKIIKGLVPNMHTKSGLMLGLGETETEIKDTIRNLRAAGCNFLSIGQYLQPSLNHYHVQSYIEPAKFGLYKSFALKLGFSNVKSSPFTRSSYQADEYLRS